MFKLLEGPQTLGHGRTFWFCFLVVLAVALVYPVFADSYDVGNFAYFLIWIFMALGLCLMWGYGGMLSFGQTLLLRHRRLRLWRAGDQHGRRRHDDRRARAVRSSLAMVRGAASSAIS